MMIQLFPQNPAAKSRQPKAKDNNAFAGKMPALKTLNRDTVKFGAGAPPSSDPDFQRYFEIIKESARRDLQKFKSPQEFEVTKDGKSVKIPRDYINTPHFTRGGNEGGVGQGEGDEGDEVGELDENGQPKPGKGEGKGKPQPGKGEKAEKGEEPGEPGDEPGEGDLGGEGSQDGKPDDWNLEISRSEIARWIGDGLELPNFEPRGANNIQKMETTWDTISRLGTQGNLHRRRTLFEALKRLMAGTQNFDPKKINFQRSDFRYQSFTERPIPKENAVIFYILDTSGSMTADRKKMARDTNFYLSTYIQYQYGKMNAELRAEKPDDKDFGNGVEERFIIHDDKAEEVPEKDFYNTTKSGGTKFAPAYEEIKRLIKEKYPIDQWNVYIFHYTDGDNFGDDNKKSIEILKELIDSGVNLYGYVETRQQEGMGGSTTYKNVLDQAFGKNNKFIRTSHIKKVERGEYAQALKDLLGKKDN